MEKPLRESTAEEEISAPQKKKRGRPRKYPQVLPPETSETPKRKRGRPKKYPVSAEEAGDRKTQEAQEKEGEQPEGELTIDVYETDEELVIQSPVAGVKPEDIDISLEDDMLLIRGERPRPQDDFANGKAVSAEARKNTILEECYWGPFSRRLVLPVEVDGTHINASLERGVLTIRMPKLAKNRKKKVVVKEMEE